MATLFRKPPGCKLNPEHIKILRNKFKFGKILILSQDSFVRSYISEDIPLEFDDGDNVVGLLGWSLPPYPIAFDGNFFFHEGGFGNLVSGDDFLKKVIGNLSPNGNMSFLELAFSSKDASILVTGSTVVSSKFPWHMENGVYYSNTDYRPYTPPVYNNYNQSRPPTPPSTKNVRRSVVCSDGIFQEISLGMGIYFKARGCRMFVSHASNGSPLRAMDLIVKADSMINPSFEYLQGIVTSKRKVLIDVLRYTFQNPNSIPIQISAELIV